MALDRLRLGGIPGTASQRQADHLGLGGLGRRVPGRPGFSSQPLCCRRVLWRGESGCSVGSKQPRPGPDICQLRNCACHTTCLSNRASPRRGYRSCDRDSSPLFRLVRWRDGPRRGVPVAIAVTELAGSCRAIIAKFRAEDLANGEPGHSRVSVAVPKPVNVASRCGRFTAAFPKAGPQANSSTSLAAVPKPVRSASESVGLQLLRARRADLQTALQLLRLLQPLRQHFLDGNQRLCRPVCQRQVEPLGRCLRRMQLQWRRCALAVQRSVAVEQH